ncbi:type I-E CRISPR-associated protein Cas7/Cse4/CasC [Bifidobacterium gallicum]|uniref:CRISPR system CASCADE complex protein CasC n=1 Tax=Bifidobacterium gallicum DSM 20093 = LMG 11596 TaxID=561180 RepID=D1NTI0_9BIFI|nr:type I-E CRISPR-associated protein Cas7/Cse4/CasC [Bifidobacterium gallicum]EFA23034.1 CRISPR system CASCADE complex protein CasC [Bifidobacterium gallicum DSM 20093 = LMG 11596]KFI57658.1 CRISPR-associated protein Cse4 [Bifidobacterium gallicum DSM 20093 = LMG 11596]
MTTIVEIYAIQNVPPSNINRDDTGNPKTAIYGGVLRARVSSQAWKRAMREAFPEMLDADQLGIRTKNALAQIEQSIVAKRPDIDVETVHKAATAALTATGAKVEKSKRKGSMEGADLTQYLIFIANREIDKLADLAIAWIDADEDLDKPSKEMKGQVSAVFHGPQAVDIALFGRMLADAPELNTDASAQVAHAISVDEVTPEYDYFTAIDDDAADDNAGAAMLDTVGFNSSTLYRYATVAVDSLYEQLQSADMTVKAVDAFVNAFLRSMPTGKQNTFANRTLPTAALVVVRNSQPINPVEAFERPVHAERDKSISRVAAERLGRKLQDIQDTYGETPIAAWNIVAGQPVELLDSLSEHVTLPVMVESLDTVLQQELAAKEQ